MAAKSLGKIVVTIPGTPVRVTANQADPTARLACHAIQLEALPANGGPVYIGNTATFNKASGAGLLMILPPPTINSISAFKDSAPLSPNGLNAADYYIDADNANEGVVGYIVVT
jgi:hypothetical protein